MRISIALISVASVFFVVSSAAYAAGSGVSFVVTQDDGFIRTKARADLETIPVPVVWSVLTDYERYPRFISSMRESKIVQRMPQALIIEQKGSFGFLFFSQNIETRIRVSEAAPRTIESYALDGDFEVMDGRYELQQLGVGTRLSFDGRLRPKFGLPPLLGLSIARSILLRNFNEMIDEVLRRDAEIRAARQHRTEE